MKTNAMVSKRTNGIRGFTLIEVLVVVAIIALLITILLPSLNRARANARMVACCANLHDLGLALNMYAQTNKGKYPPTPYVGSVELSGGLDDNLFILWYSKYAKDINLFTCPATNHRVRTPEKVERLAGNPNYPGSFYFEITTDGNLRSDFAHLAQLVPNKGYGTSYEYLSWTSKGATKTKIDWFHGKDTLGLFFDAGGWAGPIRRNGDEFAAKGIPMTQSTRFPVPSKAILMHDADEPNTGVWGDVIGAPPNRLDDQGVDRGTSDDYRRTLGPKNNKPEKWDNHGDMAMNILFGDAHAESVKAHNVKAVWRQNDVNY